MKVKKNKSFTPKVGVSGSKPEPAEAKLTPVIISLSLRFGSKYGGNKSFSPKYEAATCMKQREITFGKCTS